MKEMRDYNENISKNKYLKFKINVFHDNDFIIDLIHSFNNFFFRFTNLPLFIFHFNFKNKNMDLKEEIIC